MPLSERHMGIVYVLLATVLFSTAGLFAKGVAAIAWDIIFWRGLFAALLTSTLMPRFVSFLFNLSLKACFWLRDTLKLPEPIFRR